MRSHAPPEADWQGIAGGFVDNPLGGAGSLGCVIAGLPTNPPAHHQQPKRTDDSLYKADIFTRYRHGICDPVDTHHAESLRHMC
jgi:hypothetical protein